MNISGTKSFVRNHFDDRIVESGPSASFFKELRYFCRPKASGIFQPQRFRPLAFQFPQSGNDFMGIAKGFAGLLKPASIMTEAPPAVEFPHRAVRI